MVMRFSGEHVCQLDSLVEQARSVVSGFVVGRTDRRPGELENRDTFGNVAGAADGPN